MNRSTYTSGHSAFADARQMPNPGANAGYVAFGAARHRDVRAQSRVNAAMAVRVRTEREDRPGCIRNLSSRGLMLSMAKPPRRGEFVEIVSKGRSLIGHVKWASDNHAGIALRETIDVGSMIRGESGPVAARPQAVRKTTPRPAAATIFQSSRVVAHQLQFAAIVAFGACAALLIALCVHDLLTEVFNQVKIGLPG